jgi:oligosaccharide 4-alpha-D-glucosyltransferase
MQNTLRGLPMMRPLFMDFPEQAISRTDAYMWGDAFLIAPIIRQGQLAKELVLPKGVWFDFWDNEIYQGGSEQVIDAPLDQLPVLVKAGSFVPMTEDMGNTSNYTTNKLRVHFYAHESAVNSAYSMFDDDGRSANSIEDKAYQEISFSATLGTRDSDNEGQLNILMDVKGHYDTAPKQRSIELLIHNIQTQPKSVLVDGQVLSFTTNKTLISKEYAYYELSTNTLLVPGVLDKSLSIVIVR